MREGKEAIEKGESFEACSCLVIKPGGMWMARFVTATRPRPHPTLLTHPASPAPGKCSATAIHMWLTPSLEEHLA